MLRKKNAKKKSFPLGKCFPTTFNEKAEGIEDRLQKSLFTLFLVPPTSAHVTPLLKMYVPTISLQQVSSSWLVETCRSGRGMLMPAHSSSDTSLKTFVLSGLTVLHCSVMWCEQIAEAMATGRVNQQHWQLTVWVVPRGEYMKTKNKTQTKIWFFIFRVKERNR